MQPGSLEPLRRRLAAICERSLPGGSLTPAAREQLLDELELALESSKLESLAEFAAGAGHEINNPVATITGRAQLLLSGETDPERRLALHIIGGQALRIRDMIGDVMLFARPPLPRIEPLDLQARATQASASQRDLVARSAAQIRIEIPPQTLIHADNTQLLVVLSSLLRNSVECADGPGLVIKVTHRVEHQSNNQWTVVTVADNGPGIPEAIREHVFDPFFSGRQAGRGLGFGLSKCWRILQSHGGQILIGDMAPRGTRIETWWPLPAAT